MTLQLKFIFIAQNLLPNKSLGSNSGQSGFHLMMTLCSLLFAFQSFTKIQPRSQGLSSSRPSRAREEGGKMKFQWTEVDRNFVPRFFEIVLQTSG